MDAQRHEEILGSPEQLATEAVRQFQMRGWATRHPLLCAMVFALAPAPALLASGIAVLVSMATTADAMGIDGPGVAKWTLPWLLPVLTVILPACALVWLFRRIAVWSGADRKWRLVSLASLSLGAAIISCEVRLSDLPGESTISYAMGNLASLGQLLLPLALGLWLWHLDERPLETPAGLS